MEEFIKTAHSFLFGPDDVFGGSQYLFDTTKDGGYLKIFGDGTDLLPALTEAQFNKLVGIWFICEYVKDIWKRESSASHSEALERRWMVFFAVGQSIRQAYADRDQEFDAAVERFADPNWYVEDTNPYKAIIRRHCKLAFSALKNSYSEVSVQKEFRHRNWFRDSQTLASIQKQITNLWDVVSENGDDYRLSLAKRNSQSFKN